MPDPDPVLRLLWRHSLPSPEVSPARRGPKQKVTVDDVVDAAIDLADRDGLAALSMRGLAQHLGLGAMTLYTYVANRNDLLVLMVDQVLGRTGLPAHPADLRERLELRGPGAVRRLPGPSVAAGGDGRTRVARAAHGRPLRVAAGAVEGIGLDDIEMDQTVTLLASFGAGVARAEQVVRHAERESGMSDAVWWEANHEALGEVMAGRDYPLAGRVGTAAGEAYQAASDQRRELDFGLARIVDGLIAHLPDGS